MEKSKYDQFIAEMDSTLWPIPGQQMQNAAVVKKMIPSLQGALENPNSTDPYDIMSQAPQLGDPLQHSLVPFGEVFDRLETLRVMFETAKMSPVYVGRQEQIDVIEKILERILRIEKFLYKTVGKLDDLTLASVKDVG